MGLRFGRIATAVVLNLLHVWSVNSEDILPCDIQTLYPCPDENQYCNQTVSGSWCMCSEGYILVDKKCELYSNDPSDHMGVVGIVSIIMFILVICGIVFVLSKNSLIRYAIAKLQELRNHEPLDEDVLMGQDVPPLSP